MQLIMHKQTSLIQIATILSLSPTFSRDAVNFCLCSAIVVCSLCDFKNARARLARNIKTSSIPESSTSYPQTRGVHSTNNNMQLHWLEPLVVTTGYATVTNRTRAEGITDV